MLKAVLPEVRRLSVAMEGLTLRLCRLLTLESFAGNPACPPRRARTALKQVGSCRAADP